MAEELDALVVTNGATWVNVNNVSVSDLSILVQKCPEEVPSAAQVFSHQPWSVATVAVICGLLTLFNIIMYVEQSIHVHNHFTNPVRRKNTLVILGVFPVFSVTTLLSFYVPRSGTLMKLVANAYLGNVLYRYVSLLCSYFGDEPMYVALADHQVVLRSGPVCCCCFCLPSLTFGRKVYRRFKWMAMQVAVVRPMLMLLAAVLWTDGAYTPGNMSHRGTFLYISIFNVLSTLLAMYGLLCLTRMCQGPLAIFRLRPKLTIIQVILITTALLGIILGLLVYNDVIPCTPPMSARDRAQRLDNGIVLAGMIPLAMLARVFYCSPEDAKSTYSRPEPEEPLQEVTSQPTVKQPPTTQSEPLLHQGEPKSIWTKNSESNGEPPVTQV